MKTLILIFGGVLGLAAAGSGHAQEFRLATLAPDGSAWMEEFRAAAEEIETQTENRVRIRFFPGGVMGDAGTVLRRMRLGQLHGGAFTVGDLAPVNFDVQLYSLPFLFRSEAEFQALREEFDSLILADLEEDGLIAPAISAGGFAYLFSREPIPSPGQVSTRFKVWVPSEDRLSARTLESAGASPVPLPLAEVFTALQTGVINAFANTISGAIILQWHTRARYMLDHPLLMTTGTLALDKRVVERLSADDRKVLIEVFGDALRRLEDRSREDNKSARDALEGQGIRIIEPDSEAVATWEQIGHDVRHRMIERGQFSIRYLEALESRLEQLRADE